MMKLNLFTTTLLGLAVATSTMDVIQAQTASSAVKWVTFNDLPVQPDYRYTVPAKDSGIVQTVAVAMNDAVVKGQLLLSLEKETAQADLDMAKENLAVAVHLAADTSDLELRRLDLKQAQEMLESNSKIAGSVSASELRRLERNVVGAGVEVKKCQSLLERLGIQAKTAEHIVKTNSVKLANREVHSPSDGVVDKVLVRPGEWIDMGKPVMEITDLRQVLVDFLIPIEKTDLKNLDGLEVLVESNQRDAASAPVRLRGKIASYDSKLSSHGEVRVHCRVQNQHVNGRWQLWPGMTVRLEVGVPAQSGNEKPALISKRPK